MNRHKSVEIVVTDGRRRRLVDPPPTLHDVSRVTSVKILGVTFTCKLSLSEHVSVIVSACAPTLHALRVLRSHGMNDAALQTIYKAVVVAKLTYAASVWWGFTSADDRRRIEAVLRRGIRAGFYQSEWPTVAQLIQNNDDTLFHRVLSCSNHVLHCLLPDKRNHVYQLRSRRHDCTLTANDDTRNFIYRLLHCDIY